MELLEEDELVLRPRLTADCISCCLSQNISMTRNSTFDHVLSQSDEFPSFWWNFWRKMNLSFDHVSLWTDVSCPLSQNILMTRNSTFDHVLLRSDEFPSFWWNFWTKMNLSFDHVSLWADFSCCPSQNILMTRNFDLQPWFTAEWWVYLIIVELLGEDELEFWPRCTAALHSWTRLMHILDWEVVFWLCYRAEQWCRVSVTFVWIDGEIVLEMHGFCINFDRSWQKMNVTYTMDDTMLNSLTERVTVYAQKTTDAIVLQQQCCDSNTRSFTLRHQHWQKEWLFMHKRQ